jgi:hypothetical protein
MHNCAAVAAFARRLRGWFLVFVALAICSLSDAADAGPRITRALKDVKLVSPQGSARAAALNQPIGDGSVVRTGPDSRAEIAGRAAGDCAHRRELGAQIDAQGRTLELQEGAVLFQAAKGGGSPKLTTANIHVATAGSTGVIERYGAAYVKILVLEGTARVYLQKIGESVLVNAGQMLITRPGAARLPEPVHFEIAKLYKTSLLANADFAPLASSARIEAAIREQQSDPSFTPTIW